MNLSHYKILNFRLPSLLGAFTVFLVYMPLQFGYSQENIMTKVQVAELVKRNSERLKKQIKDSAVLYTDLQKAKNILEQRQKSELLANSYKNLASWHNKSISIDSVEYYYKKAASTYSQIESKILEAEMYLLLEDAYKQRSDYSSAMAIDFKALEIFEKLENQSGIAKVYTRLCDILYYQQEYKEGAEYCQKAIDVQIKLEQPDELAISYRYKADNLLILENYEEALTNINLAIKVLKDANRSLSDIAPNFNTRGNIYKYMGRYDDAIEEYTRCYDIAKANSSTRGIITSLGNLGHVYRLQEKYENSISYTQEAIKLIKESGNTQNLAENYMHISDSYKAMGDFENALNYERLYGDEKMKNLNSIIDQLESELQIKYETEKKDKTIENQEAKLERQKRIQQLYFGIGFLLVIILLGMFFTIKNNKKKRAALLELNGKINNKQTQLEKSNSQLKSSLQELKATQEQLIQSEKMASLGELTAGIAHEIQNPLNFVNNFSELNKELVDEANEELDKGDIKETRAVLKDLGVNSEKINHHGKRADSIVKGMLQHSRSSDNTKEPTDINKLADEYLRLAYHGLRAKNKSFNANLETDFDKSIGFVSVIPQDVGRVILNILANAFYATLERQKEEKTDYKPTIKITTKKQYDSVSIEIADNGNGMPKHIKDKIFQPFFTTKPTGQGTGLGLSMSYDIITKGHNGKLQVESELEKGSIFIINLPI